MTVLSYQCDDKIFQINFPNHHKSHEWKNGRPPADALTVHPRMLSMFRATTVAGSVLINLSSFHYLKDGEIKVVPETTLNMTSYIPVTLNHVRLVLLGYNMDTHVHEIVPGVSSFFSAATPPELPTGIPNNFLPSALIRLRYNVTELSDLDVTDARMVLGGEASAATGNVSKLVGLGGTPDPVLSAGADGDLTAIGNMLLTNPDAGIIWDISGNYAYLKGVAVGGSTSRIEWHIEPTTGGVASVYMQAGTLVAGATLIATNVDGDPSSDEIAAYIGPDKQLSISNGGIALTDGNRVNTISDDPTLLLAQHTALVTEFAAKSYIDSVGGWPLTRAWVVGSSPHADFTDLQDAIDDASVTSGDVIILDGDLSLSASITLNKNSITITTVGSQSVTLTSSITNAPAIYVTADNCTLRNFAIVHTGAGTLSGCVAYDGDDLLIDNMKLYKPSGSASESYGIWGFGGTARVTNGTQIYAVSGSVPYGVYNSSGTTELTIEAGVLVYGASLDIYGTDVSSILYLKLPSTGGSMNISWAGVVNGWSLDSTGTLVSHDSVAGIRLVNKITEFSTDGTLADNSDDKVSTQKAVRTFVTSQNKVLYNITKTVKPGGGGDFTTISDAISYFAGHTCIGCVISVDPGNYTGDRISLTSINTANVRGLVVVGDTRTWAGMSYLHNQKGNPLGIVNAGAQGGNCTLSSSGNTISVSVVGANPNFANMGMVVGDTVIVRTTGGSYTTTTVSSISGNVLTLASPPGTVAGNGGSITLCPNRHLYYGAGENVTCYIQAGVVGFRMTATAGQGSIGCYSGGMLLLYNCTMYGGSHGVICNDFGTVVNESQYSSCIANASVGWLSQYSSNLHVPYCYAIGAASQGFLAQLGSRINAYSGQAGGCVTGLSAYYGSFVYADLFGAGACTTAVHASVGSVIQAGSSSAQISGKGNTTNYSPATSGAVGNIGSYINWS